MNDYYLYSYLVVGAVLFFLLLAYAPRLVAWFGAFLPYERLHNDRKNKIAVLVPARNESAVIGTLLRSLSLQTYREAEVFVIVKDKKDPTIPIAKHYGFHVHVEASQTCKSDALDGAIQGILRKDRDAFDAFLILDADTMIKEDYLDEMNNAMASGRDVIVSKKIVKNYFMKKGSLTFQGAANGYIWTIFDEMGNKWKSLHHIANFTVGSGLLISKKIILFDHGWCYKSTLTEDCELAGDIIANHWSTYYAPYAPIYMEEAPCLSDTNKRRTRWMTGLTDAQRMYRYKDETMGSFWDNYFCYSIFISYAYFFVLCAFAFSNAVAMVVFFFLNSPEFWWALYGLAGSLGLVYLSFFTMALFAFFAQRKDLKGHWFFRLLTVFYVPIHYLGYIRIMAKVFTGKSSRRWDEISRVGVKEAH
jgi:cellulose synthase/poly-beta-1,6-N-acetylglucosamine synthase-like glycosyltransferase